MGVYSQHCPRRAARNVVIDRDVRVPPGLVVGEDPVLDAQRFRRSQRSVVRITKPMIDGITP